MRDKYKYIGPVYDFLSNLYSGKNIHRCKTAMLDVETVKPATAFSLPVSATAGTLSGPQSWREEPCRSVRDHAAQIRRCPA